MVGLPDEEIKKTLGVAANEAGRYGEATMCDWTDTVFAIAQLVGSCSVSLLCMAGIGAMIYWFRRNSES